jgi:hypothetical protein
MLCGSTLSGFSMVRSKAKQRKRENAVQPSAMPGPVDLEREREALLTYEKRAGLWVRIANVSTFERQPAIPR